MLNSSDALTVPTSPTSPELLQDYSDAHRPLYEVKANLFRGLSHPVRVRILEVLAATPVVPAATPGKSASDVPGAGVSVANLLADTGLEASNLSQHLSVLRRNNLVVAERRGSFVFYRLAYPQVADLLTVAKALLVEILESTHTTLRSTVSL